MTMGSLFGEICHMFCCPPRPSHIVAKFAFLPPPATYTIVQSSDGNKRQIIFKPEAGHISDYAKLCMEVFYTMTKRNSRIACLYIYYDSIDRRHSLSNGVKASRISSSNRITVLFSHGNAVDIGQMADFLHSLSQRFGVNILVYDYSGYGASTGQTLEANLYADAEAALSELVEKYHCPLNRVVLYGQSIGSAPTVELATHHAVAGVILHSALMSGLRVVCPGTTRGFCFDPFNSIDKVERIQSPTLIIHGTDDRIIGVHHGKELFARLPNPLEPLWVEGADHNDIELFHEYTIRLEQFFQRDMQLTTSTEITPSHDERRSRSQLTVAGETERNNPSAPHPNHVNVAEVQHNDNQRQSWASAAASCSSSSSSSETTSSTTPAPQTTRVQSAKVKAYHLSFRNASANGASSVSGNATGSSISLPLNAASLDGDGGGSSLHNSQKKKLPKERWIVSSTEKNATSSFPSSSTTSSAAAILENEET